MRVADRVLSAILALALMVGGLLVAAEIVLGGLGRGPWILPYDRWERSAVATPWSDGNARLIGLALVGGGVVVLAVQVARRRPQALDLTGGKDRAPASLDRRGVERWLADRVERVEGVADARTRLRRRVAVVRASSVGQDHHDVERRLRETVAGHLGELDLAMPLRVDVRVASRSDGG